jgi:hypothetical protein
MSSYALEWQEYSDGDRLIGRVKDGVEGPLLFNDFAIHVRPERFGNKDAAVLLLVILNYGDHDTRQGQAGTVEGMYKARL